MAQKYSREPVKCLGCDILVTPNRVQARDLATGRQKGVYHSRECYLNHLAVKRNGEDNPHWKGGVSESWGYVYHHDTTREQANKYKPEHHIIAEQKIGRAIRPDEVVHHINGKKWDNRPENLEVMTRSEHMRYHAQKRWDERKGRNA